MYLELGKTSYFDFISNLTMVDFFKWHVNLERSGGVSLGERVQYALEPQLSTIATLINNWGVMLYSTKLRHPKSFIGKTSTKPSDYYTSIRALDNLLDSSDNYLEYRLDVAREYLVLFNEINRMALLDNEDALLMYEELLPKWKKVFVDYNNGSVSVEDIADMIEIEVWESKGVVV